MSIIRVSEQAYEKATLQAAKDNRSVSQWVSMLIMQHGASKARKKTQTVPGLKELWIEANPQYIWSAADASHLLALQKKIILLSGNDAPERIKINFQAFLNKLPQWYQDKGLSILNSKFNDIIKQASNRPYDPAAKFANDELRKHNHPQENNDAAVH